MQLGVYAGYIGFGLPYLVGGNVVIRLADSAGFIQQLLPLEVIFLVFEVAFGHQQVSPELVYLRLEQVLVQLRQQLPFLYLAVEIHVEVLDAAGYLRTYGHGIYRLDGAGSGNGSSDMAVFRLRRFKQHRLFLLPDKKIPYSRRQQHNGDGDSNAFIFSHTSFAFIVLPVCPCRNHRS